MASGPVDLLSGGCFKVVAKVAVAVVAVAVMVMARSAKGGA